ncbi:hypothetical protein PpBr36_06876 [Pyricularia pennisetigena]|uniref:hypothetical protein n=1 Tax=Pyricularia pennisetigena TaxID=1578925 RepID=UPI00114EFC5F|nr:hypothetical protein PpBr36_06876 [Pyricularia pennisetigena]TLS25801.1 hypothetical protein PpBr36_06876 [Pyricularia pennisetigena]
MLCSSAIFLAPSLASQLGPYRSEQWTPPGSTRTCVPLLASALLCMGPPGRTDELTVTSRHVSNCPLAYMRRGMLRSDHPPVHAFRSASVLPCAKPYAPPGNHSSHWSVQYLLLTSRETIEGRPSGAPFCHQPKLFWLEN